jgi:hypothetical protein
MIVKEFRELVRDRRTLGLLIMMPLLLLVIFGYAANFYVSSLKTAVVGPQAASVAGMLPPFFDVTQTQPSGTRADAETLLRDNRADVALRWAHNLDDGSASFSGSLTYVLGARTQLLCVASLNRGSSDAEFPRLLRHSVLLGLRLAL